MTTIHMDTEHVRETARLLDQWAADMDSKGTGLRAALGELSGLGAAQKLSFSKTILPTGYGIMNPRWNNCSILL